MAGGLQKKKREVPVGPTVKSKLPGKKKKRIKSVKY